MNEINLQHYIEDEIKWFVAEWQGRHHWAWTLSDYQKSILNGTPTCEEKNLFWIRLYGFLKEFIKNEHIEEVLSIKETVQTNASLPASYEAYFKEIDLVVQKMKTIMEKISTFRVRFTEEEFLYLYDYRNHMAHPVASHYRLKISKNGIIHEKEKRIETQEILANEHSKYESDCNETTTYRACYAYALKIANSEIIEVRDLAYELTMVLDPILTTYNLSKVQSVKDHWANRKS